MGSEENSAWNESTFEYIHFLFNVNLLLQTGQHKPFSLTGFLQGSFGHWTGLCITCPAWAERGREREEERNESKDAVVFMMGQHDDGLFEENKQRANRERYVPHSKLCYTLLSNEIHPQKEIHWHDMICSSHIPPNHWVAFRIPPTVNLYENKCMHVWVISHVPRDIFGA